MHLAHLLVQGVDLWLNLPRVPLEASGTSGMKAALNGIPQLSTLDGWWQEGYDGLSGWAISPAGESEDADAADAGPVLPAARGAGHPALLHAQRGRRPARLGREDAPRAAAGGLEVHRPAHGAGLRAGALRSRDPRRVVRRRSADGMRHGRMATVHQPGIAPASARPPLTTSGRRAGLRRPRDGGVFPVCPHRRPRRGGQRAGAASSRPPDSTSWPILPLYRTVRDVEPDLEPVGPPFLVSMGGRTEEARVFRAAGPRPGPQVFFIEHLDYFNRPGIYGENAVDYPTTPAASPSSRSRRSRPCPGW